MAGLRGKSGQPKNQNAFRHGLAAIHNRRAKAALTEKERDIRTEILAGLITDTGGQAQITTATRIWAEIIASDVALLVTFNQAIEASSRTIQRPEPGQPISSGSAWTRFPKLRASKEIIEQMGEDDGLVKLPIPTRLMTTSKLKMMVDQTSIHSIR